MIEPDVKVGQTWEDCDKRMLARRMIVVEVNDTYAWMVYVDPRGNPWRTAHRIRLLIRRMRPTSTGFRLVKEVTP